LKKFNAFTAITKHHTLSDWVSQKDVSHAFITIGMNDGELNKAVDIIKVWKDRVSNFTPKIVIDVANGYMNSVL